MESLYVLDFKGNSLLFFQMDVTFPQGIMVLWNIMNEALPAVPRSVWKTPDGTPRLSSPFPHIAFVPIFPSFGDFDFTSLQLMLVPCVGRRRSSRTSPVQITFLFPCDHWVHIMEFYSCI